MLCTSLGQKCVCDAPQCLTDIMTPAKYPERCLETKLVLSGQSRIVIKSISASENVCAEPIRIGILYQMLNAIFYFLLLLCFLYTVYIITHPLTYLPIYIQYQPIYLPTYLPTNIPAYIHTYLPTNLPAFNPYLFVYMYTYLFTYLPTYLPIYTYQSAIPTCLSSYLHTYLPS